MEFPIEIAKWKWIWTKDIDLNKIYIWVNWSKQLWIELFKSHTDWMSIKVGDTELICYIWDSTTPFRWTNDDSVLLQLMVEINPMVIWVLLTNDLILTIN